MEIAKISSKGQITIPISVRNRLHLNTGDKVLILEENGRFYIENAVNMAFKREITDEDYVRYKHTDFHHLFSLRSNEGIYQTGGAWEPDCVMRLCD